MKLSNLGLSEAEVAQIMGDIAGRPAFVEEPKAPKPTTPTVSPTVGAVPVPGQPGRLVLPLVTTKPPVTFTEGQPLKKQPVASAATQKTAAPPSRLGPVVVGATTGLIFGGPVGAAIGAGGMFLLSKLIPATPEPTKALKGLGADIGARGDIANNHGHVLMIPVEDLAATSNGRYDIRGSANHGHQVLVTIAQLKQVAAGKPVSVVSSAGNGHTHQVTVFRV